MKHTGVAGQVENRHVAGVNVPDVTRALWWRLSHEPLNWKRDFGGYVGVLDYSPDGHTIAVATMNGGITVLDSLTSQTRILRGPTRQVTALVYGPTLSGYIPATGMGSLQFGTSNSTPDSSL